MYTKKQREPCVLFLEAGFGTKQHPQGLRDAGWSVECFRTHFCDDNGRMLDGIKDPDIIKFCASKSFLLITTDRQMRNTHVETIKKTEVAIIATVDSNHPLQVWVAALNKSKAQIERYLKKQPRPWFAIIGINGSIRIETISPEAYTRRNRPYEGQEKG